MKTLLKKRKRIVAMLSALALMLCACGQRSQTELGRDYKAEAEAVPGYCVSKEDCFLCAAQTESFGQNNVGVISLSTFAFMPVEINRYDRSGQLIEESTGTMQMRTFQNGEDGMTATVMLGPDRGIAHVTISLQKDATLDLTSAAAHLCSECLEELASTLQGNVCGVGIVNFSSRRLYALQESITGFGAGDYYVHCDFDVPGGKVNILITYNPIRYENET